MTKRSTKKPMIKRATGEKYPTAVVETDGPGQQGAPDAPTADGHQDTGSTDAAASPARDAYRDTLTHVDEKGDVRMVDVSDKAVTQRLAVAEGSILMHPETQAMVLEDRAKKGDVLACARVAGIMASKRTSDLIPMCHPLMITKSKVDIEPIPAQGDGARADGRVGFRVTSTLGVTGVTGIEMEALTATSVACLTIYDMCKAVDRGMEIVDVRLLHKEGGRSGVWERAEQTDASAVAPATDTAPATDAAPDSAETADPVEPEPASPLPGGPGAKAAAPAIADTRIPARPRWWKRSSSGSRSAGCASAPSSTTGTRGSISTSRERTPGATRRRAAAMWAWSRPANTPNTPTPRTRCRWVTCSPTIPTWTS